MPVGTVAGPGAFDLADDQSGLFQHLQVLADWLGSYRASELFDDNGTLKAELAELVHVSGPTIIMMWENGLRHPRKECRQRLNAELGGDVFFK